MKKEDNISPIEQIRRAEAEVTRQVAAAREAAEETLQAAKAQAARLHAEALQEGKQEGEQHCQQIIDQAKEAASQIVIQANEQAKEMRRNGLLHMDRVAQQALHYVLDMQADQGGSDEH